jgi:Ca-activated chloride channel family protein
MDSSMQAFWRAVRGLSRAMASRLLPLVLLASPAHAQETPVAIELVLALDASASVDRQEFALQVEGLAAAFRDPDVQRAVEDLQPLGVAIAVVQWGGPGDTHVVLPFTQLNSRRDAKAFAFRMGLVHRFMWASVTSIATGITDSAALIEGNEFDGQRKVIDVSGDGEDNGTPDLDAARKLARAQGIIINGLPIMADSPGLADYYKNHVVIGPDSFVEPARDFDDYARAIRAKLLKELRPLAS